MQSCKDQSLIVKIEKGNNLRIYCSTTAFEKTRKQIVRSTQENANLEHIENEDQKGQVQSEILRPKDTWTAGNIQNKYLQNQKQLLNKWATSTKIYLGDTTMDTVMGAGKQNRNRHVQPAVRKDAQKA